MNPDPNMQDTILTAALERKPQIAAPAGFHARLLASLPHEEAQTPMRRIRFARAAAYLAAACLAVVLIALTSLHPDAISTPWSMPFVLELIVLAQLMAVGYWLGTRRES